MTRFDQEPNKPYAHCTHEDCQNPPLLFATRVEMDEHLHSTFEANKTATGDYGGSGHSARIDNPTREERIKSAVNMAASDALDSALTEFTDDVYRLHSQDGATLEEITEAVKSVYAEPEWADAWREYIEDDS